MVHVALEAADKLAEDGIETEVIDPRTLTPLDEETLVASAKKTSRCIVLDEGYRRFGATAELGSVIAEQAFYHLDAPVRRIAAMDVPVPFAPTLEDQTIPNTEGVVGVAREMLGR
jgi:pyruvate dehydrogenase E1 component beta subunit